MWVIKLYYILYSRTKRCTEKTKKMLQHPTRHRNRRLFLNHGLNLCEVQSGFTGFTHSSSACISVRQTRATSSGLGTQRRSEAHEWSLSLKKEGWHVMMGHAKTDQSNSNDANFGDTSDTGGHVKLLSERCWNCHFRKEVKGFQSKRQTAVGGKLIKLVVCVYSF